MKKYIFAAALFLGLLVSPAFTQAAGLTTVQINAIISLLQSFGADAATVANVNASLTGTTPSSGTQAWCHTFSTNLKKDDEGSEVRFLDIALQKEKVGTPNSFEGQNPTLISDDGVFISGTVSAVKAFQKKYGITQTGTAGPMTRAKLNKLYGCKTLSDLTVVTVEALTHTPSSYINKKVQTTGTLKMIGKNYFTDSSFAVTDGTNTFRVNAWLVLEVVPPMPGSVEGQPSTMATYVDKTVTLQGVVEQDAKGFLLRVTKTL